MSSERFTPGFFGFRQHGSTWTQTISGRRFAIVQAEPHYWEVFEIVRKRHVKLGAQLDAPSAVAMVMRATHFKTRASGGWQSDPRSRRSDPRHGFFARAARPGRRDPAARGPVRAAGLDALAALSRGKVAWVSGALGDDLVREGMLTPDTYIPRWESGVQLRPESLTELGRRVGAERELVLGKKRARGRARARGAYEAMTSIGMRRVRGGWE